MIFPTLDEQHAYSYNEICFLDFNKYYLNNILRSIFLNTHSERMQIHRERHTGGQCNMSIVKSRALMNLTYFCLSPAWMPHTFVTNVYMPNPNTSTVGIFSYINLANLWRYLHNFRGLLLQMGVSSATPGCIKWDVLYGLWIGISFPDRQVVLRSDLFHYWHKREHLL
jgi:hypothetical protein